MERNGKKNDGKQSIAPQRLKRLFQEQKKFSNPSASDLSSVNKTIEDMFPEKANEYKKVQRSGNLAQKYGAGMFYEDKRKEIAKVYERVIEKEIEIFSDNADLGSRTRKQRKTFNRVRIDNARREHKKWVEKGRDIKKAKPGLSVRAIANIICNQPLDEKRSFQTVYRVLLKNSV